MRGAVLGEVTVTLGGQQSPAPVQLAGQAAEEPVDAVGIGGGDDRAAVRQGGQRSQAAAAVDGVQVNVVRARLGGEASGQGPQQRAAPGLRRSGDQQVTAAPISTSDLSWPGSCSAITANSSTTITRRSWAAPRSPARPPTSPRS